MGSSGNQRPGSLPTHVHPNGVQGIPWTSPKGSPLVPSAPAAVAPPTYATPAVRRRPQPAAPAGLGERDGQGAPSASLVAVQGLWKVYGRQERHLDVEDPGAVARAEDQGAVVAVRNVSFQVKPGEIFVVMGLSGSGKSTLVRCLLRLVEPTAGRVVVAGQDVTAMDPRRLTQFRRTRVAMVFQHYSLLPHRTVLENVTFGLRLRGEPRQLQLERARAALAQVGLEGWETRYPAALSGGMQQRVGIARALARDADLLLMDEPFSGLDPLIRRQLQDELLRLQSELHKTIVFITHDLQEALRLADRMAIMRAGSFVQVGRPRDIIHQPADDYVRRFVQDVRETAALAQSAAGALGRTSTDGAQGGAELVS